MTGEARFPFGQLSTPRPPRRPAHAAELFVLGVYPSALHVRWQPPTWARLGLGVGPVGALAVADEPCVFWDGADAAQRVAEWRTKVTFIEGDDEGCWGHATTAGNGTSGSAVAEGVLVPFEVEPANTWFTDAVDHFFVKQGKSGGRRQQADAIEADYAPFAAAAGLPSASLPARPVPDELVSLAASQHGDRLRAEFEEANAPLVVTLGEEARRVLMAIADKVDGAPAQPLDGRWFAVDEASYGRPGIARVGGMEAQCYALVHPGQRSTGWRQLHDRWRRRVAPGLA